MQPSSQVVPAASPKPSLELPVTEDENYPEDSGTRPYDIAAFIRDHPSGKLERLWQRLGIKGDDPDSSYDFRNSCSHCEANIFQYNLDADAEREVVLQIKEALGQSYRYLIFKDSSEGGDTKFLGHIDVWAKYPPADPVVLMSKGRAWLIVQSTAAAGSGLGAWLDTVYEVSNGRVRPVATYLARVNQSGFFSFPSKVFVASPMSCEIKHGHAILTMSYTVEYFGYSDRHTPLFTKHQSAVLRGSLRNGSTFLDVGTSEVAPGEFESIYNFDSMGEDKFLKYNHSELRGIAMGNNAEKKRWLSEFLDTCRNVPIKRELLALLR